MVQAFPQLHVFPCVADICDEARIRQLFTAHRPALVLHAAAHKHVPMMEWNAGEAVKNNVLGTRAIARLADAWEASPQRRNDLRGLVHGECRLRRIGELDAQREVEPTS